MKSFINKSSLALPRWTSISISAIMVWVLVGVGFGSSAASVSASGPGPAAPTVTCPAGQCFTDVPGSNPFYAFINSLYIDNIISGYPCGGPGELCDSFSRPYYRPNNNVTRAQMSKFVDNGRRNIADAVGLSLQIGTVNVAGQLSANSAVIANSLRSGVVTVTNVLNGGDMLGHSLVISGTAYNTLDVRTNSGGSAIVGTCLTPGTACYAVAGGAPAGDFAGYFAGGRGVYAGSQDAARPALDTAASGTTAVGVNAFSQQYRGLEASRNTTAYFALLVDKISGELTNNTIARVDASMEVVGNLTVDGSKGGYVVDAMQNVDSTPRTRRRSSHLWQRRPCLRPDSRRHGPQGHRSL